MVYETSAEYPAINGGDECGAGVRGMQYPSLLFKMPCGLPQGASLKKALEGPWKASNVKILYEREIKLKDDTQAYEFEVKWKSGMWPLHSYAVIVFKDKKIIEVIITSLFWVGDNQKQYPLSLILK